jgi:hypothetical protein
VPKGFIDCGLFKFTITGVPPKAAPDVSPITGRKPDVGEVAINPKNYGLPYDTISQRNSAIRKLRKTKILYYPDWDKAEITGRNGKGTVEPAPKHGMPQIPDGLPSKGPYSAGVDSGDIVDARNARRLDVYRYPTA